VLITLPTWGAGLCADPEYKNMAPTQENNLNAGALKVIRNDTPLYETPSPPTTQQTETKKLAFDKSLVYVSSKDDWIQVRETNQPKGKTLGWINAKDLLCNHVPLQGKAGQEKILYIKTTTAIREDAQQGIIAYNSPIDGEKHHDLYRFTPYFVFAEQEIEQDGKHYRRYLLGQEYFIGATTNLVGWVDETQSFLWTSAFGLRPKEDLGDKTICAYKKLDDAAKRNLNSCMPIVGGDRWYKVPVRIPIVKQVNQQGVEDEKGQYYQIIVPMPGQGVCSSKNGKVILCPETFKYQETDLSHLTQVDVLFLLDGTQSMEGYLSQAKQAVGDIRTQMQDDEKMQGTQFRFALQIYRDHYAGEHNLGDKLEFPSECEVSETSLQKNIKDFNGKLSDSQTTSERLNAVDNDFSENFYGGLQQAARELRNTCEKHIKVLFVIGDHGGRVDEYNKIRAALASDIAGDQNTKQPIVTLFLQIPQDATLSNNTSYIAAYRDFSIQGQEIAELFLKGIKKTTKSTPHQANDYVLKLDSADLAKRVISKLKDTVIAGPKVVKDLEIALNGGEATAKAIERLKNRTDVPGLFWELAQQQTCSSLPGQCTKNIYDVTFEGYIPINDNLQYDIWFNSTSLSTYISILEGVIPKSTLQESPLELRQAFIEQLRTALEHYVKEPLYANFCSSQTVVSANDCPIEEYMKRAGHLPVRLNSPLFKFSLNDLENSNRVSDCVINDLARWVGDVHEILSYVRGDNRPAYEIAHRAEGCEASKVPYIMPNTIRKGQFSDNEMSYSYVPETRGVKIYWVPQEFLP